VSELTRGLYETLLTSVLEARLRELSAARRLEPMTNELRPAEAADRLALHLGIVLRRALAALEDERRVPRGIELARKLLEIIDATVERAEAVRDAPVASGRVLRALAARLPDGTPEEIASPLIPLLDTTLLTNSPGEPRVLHQILTEIGSADRIDVVMAFIRWSGVRPLHDALRTAIAKGTPVRVVTTTFTGSTEQRALDALRDIGVDVRVSYDTGATRLHAKAWLFHRRSGFSTAYIGSSNLSHAAQQTGLEWNVRVSAARNPDVVDKMSAVFETYWNSGDFAAYDPAEFADRLPSAEARTELLLPPTELRAEPFQERLLEQVALSRELGHHRNLLVAATGTGKTVMAALDYARLRATLARARLLFVAHREEILAQSQATFRHCLRDAAFGELWVGGRRPQAFEHVFASIQSLHAAGLRDLAPDHFDVVIVDEFHHAAAPSYRALLEHVRPVELLGLTATPERSDGLPLLGFFGNRIAAELRLWDAIDQHRLVPFLYYGVHDGLDLREVPWRRGRGYDPDGLTNVLTANDAWAVRVLECLRKNADDPSRIRALGFCVSVAHARFMARVFRDAGVDATAIWADSPPEERRAALTDLAARRVNVVFSVDLFNEGIDVPAVDTLLLLRPTDSPTLFLQQLGRGLRRAEGKTACTVLDFVGHHRKEFRFDRRFGALFGGSRKELAAHLEAGFPFLPAGCHMQLDPVAAEIVLRSIRESLPSRFHEKVLELRRLAAGAPVAFARFLQESGLELEDVYANGHCWSDLIEEAGLPAREKGPDERGLRRALGRLLHLDDTLRISTLQRLLAGDAPPNVAALQERDRRLLRMLLASLRGRNTKGAATLSDAAAALWRHPQVRAELRELLDVLATRVTHVSHPLATHPEVPLQVHARYSRVEILTAFTPGSGTKPHSWQSGVHWAKEARADLFAFTLDKTSGQFSPTTRYRDYAISRELIHWESQSITRTDSETGRRYIHHREQGTHVMLFARLRAGADERAFWFLGPADYVNHAGEQPIAFTWRLHHPLPGDLFALFAAAMA
jgi:superfamily II DNA or RNA helicase/HKD family nuclease